MKTFFNDRPNGYLETIHKGLDGVRFFRDGLVYASGNREEALSRLRAEIEKADAIVIGAGAGLSTAAGLTYSGERFERYFFDFEQEYGIKDIYSGGFFPFPDEETTWAWWARHIYFNRYIEPAKPVYRNLLSLVKDKDYFVITTNVDHQFQRAGFDKKRLFYTQGDYGLFQSSDPHDGKTYDNEDWVMKAMEAQGFVRDETGVFCIPENLQISMRIPSELIPSCPDGSGVVMNLRSDDSFVEDEGWKKASASYSDFLHRTEGKHVLFWEIGVGANTPVIIKYPFWVMTYENPDAVYACMNQTEAVCPKKISQRSICLEGDAAEAIGELCR